MPLTTEQKHLRALARMIGLQAVKLMTRPVLTDRAITVAVLCATRAGSYAKLAHPEFNDPNPEIR